MTAISTIKPSPIGVFDGAEFAKLALENMTAYREAAPFPNIAFDEFLPQALAKSVSLAFPEPEAISWIDRQHANNRRRYQHDETKLPRLVRAMLREMNSRGFLVFLELLTGIEGLIPDPYFIGGGAHLSGPGDFLKVHTDFNWHHKLQAHRRVNALLYLTQDWREDWRGALEFWDRDAKSCVTSHLPLFNRLVVFSTSEHSYHGQREPLVCPIDVRRKVLNVYYYTSRRNDGEIAEPHFTSYKTEA